jgi:uncharacterized membrane protein
VSYHRALEGGTFTGQGYGLTPDGSIIVGASQSTNGSEAYYWTAETGMVGMGDLVGGDFHSNARAISADGKVIVG